MQEDEHKPLTLALEAAAAGEPQAADRLFPLVYAQLRSVAQNLMRQTPPGNTLQATALVHEAFMKLVGNGDPGWDGRWHFFGAAGRAMREILVDQARRKAAIKHGGGRGRRELIGDERECEIVLADPAEDVLALDAALERLKSIDPRKAEVVQLRYFAGLTQAEVARALGASERTIDREWRYAKAWLKVNINGAVQTDGAPVHAE